MEENKDNVNILFQYDILFCYVIYESYINYKYIL